MEGEFGKFEQEVGTFYFDDSSEDQLKKTAVREALRAYVSGINHAGRVEFDGKSRERVLRDTCPDPEKDRQFIAELHSPKSVVCDVHGVGLRAGAQPGINSQYLLISPLEWSLPVTCATYSPYRHFAGEKSPHNFPLLNQCMALQCKSLAQYRG